MDVAISSAWHECKSDVALDTRVNKSRGYALNLVRNKWKCRENGYTWTYPAVNTSTATECRMDRKMTRKRS